MITPTVDSFVDTVIFKGRKLRGDQCWIALTRTCKP